jgi:uncharacterized repeat protein (TIGR03803 family)
MAIVSGIGRAAIAGLALGLSAAALAAPPVTEELLHEFAYLDGYAPKSALIQASDGNYYGTTDRGSVNQFGTIYRLAPDGVYTVIHTFELNCDGGCRPVAGLMQASNGWLYGTTAYGGAFDKGVVFRVSLAGDYEVLDAFSADKGYEPRGTLIEAPAGGIGGQHRFRPRHGVPPVAHTVSDAMTDAAGYRCPSAPEICTAVCFTRSIQPSSSRSAGAETESPATSLPWSS